MAIKVTDNNVLSLTNQDYDSIMLEILKTRREIMPEYTDETDTDFGNLILSYVGMLFDILSWKVDFSVNEAIPLLAKTKKAIYLHCKSLGYKPNSNRAASAKFEIEVVWDGKTIVTLPKTTKLTMAEQINGKYIKYEPDYEVVCNPPKGTKLGDTFKVQFTCHQGESVSETLGYSNGKADQEYYITLNPYIEDSIYVIENNINTGKQYKYTQNENNSFVGTEAKDRTIVLEQIDDKTIKVKFGDGYNSCIPSEGSQLIAYYRIGGGVIGNRPKGVINVSLDTLPNVVNSIQNIEPTIGGIDADDVATIKADIKKGRYKIIYALMQQKDFDNFLYNRSEYIEKFRACKDTIEPARLFRPIAVYVKPYRTLYFSEEEKQALRNEMMERALLDDIINVYDVIPIAVKVEITIKKDALTNANDILYNIKYTIQQHIDSLRIGGNPDEDDAVGLFADDIRSIVREVEGVARFVSINELWVKHDEVLSEESEVLEEGKVMDMVLARGQMFVIEDIESDVVINIV